MEDSLLVSGLPFSRITCNHQIIETTTNRSFKSIGGFSENIENIGASEKWMCLKHIMAALREHLDSVILKRTSQNILTMIKKRLLQDEKDAKMLSEPFVNLVTGKEGPKNKKKIQLLQKMKISLLVKCYRAVTTAL